MLVQTKLKRDKQMTTKAFKDNDICTIQAFEKIDNSNGKIFRTKFIKKSNGKIRSMLARTNVRKNLKGKGSFDPKEYGLRRVYDMELARKNKNENCYRHINSNIEYLKIKGKEHNVYKCSNLAKYFYGKSENENCPMCNTKL